MFSSNFRSVLIRNAAILRSNLSTIEIAQLRCKLSYTAIRRLESSEDLVNNEAKLQTITDTQSESIDTSVNNNTRGKKIKPEKPNIVVLDHRQAGLLKVKKEIKRPTSYPISALEGLDIGDDIRKDVKLHKPNNEHVKADSLTEEELQKILVQRKKLLVYESKVTEEQAAKSIDYLKPQNLKLSVEKLNDLKKHLNLSYTVKQLRMYTKLYYKKSYSHLVKSQVIDKIVFYHWKCTTSDGAENDTNIQIDQRVIDLETNELYLLVLTKKGKILQNFADMGAKIIVAVDENKIIIHGNINIIKYIEVALSRLVKNIHSEKFLVDDIVKSYLPKDHKYNENDIESLLLSIEKECNVFFEKSIYTDNNVKTQDRNISAIGTRRIGMAKRLFFAALKFDLFKKEAIKTLLIKEKEHYHEYPISDTRSMNWLCKTDPWSRVSRPNKIIDSQKEDITETNNNSKSLFSEDIVNGINDYIFKEQQIPLNNLRVSSKLKSSSIFSVTLGQLLNSTGKLRNTFDPQVPALLSKIDNGNMKLYEELQSYDEYFSTDHHSYFVKYVCVPNLKDDILNLKNLDIPPLEIWFESNESRKIDVSTCRLILPISQKKMYLRTPDLDHDFRIDYDTSVDLCEKYQLGNVNWLEGQPSIRNILSTQNFNSYFEKGVLFSQDFSLNIPIEGEEVISVNYKSIDTELITVINLKYKDKYLAQLSQVKRQILKGEYSQLDFVIEDNNSEENLLDLLRNIEKF